MLSWGGAVEILSRDAYSTWLDNPWLTACRWCPLPFVRLLANDFNSALVNVHIAPFLYVVQPLWLVSSSFLHSFRNFKHNRLNRSTILRKMLVSRYSGSCVMYLLMTSDMEEFDRAVSIHVEPKDQRNIQDKIFQLKQKVNRLIKNTLLANIRHARIYRK